MTRDRAVGGRVKLAVVAVLAIYVAWLVTSFRYHFLDGVNLLVHEAGHIVFAPLGETPGVLGGTLLQLAFPVAFVAYFARGGRRFEAACCAVWASESAMYTAEYVADANAQVLPLVGGHVHDWAWLLGRAGWLDAAEELGLVLHLAASLTAILAVSLTLLAARSPTPGPDPSDAAEDDAEGDPARFS